MLKFFRIYLICLQLICLVSISNSQEITVNGGFEDYLNPPMFAGQWTDCLNWNHLIRSGGSTMGTPDFYHEDGTVKLSSVKNVSISAHSGNGAMGIAGNSPAFGPLQKNWHEYVSTKFAIPMDTNGVYSLSFWITNGGLQRIFDGYSCDGFGILLSINPIQQYAVECIPISPQLKIDGEIWENEWRQYTFLYEPDSNYSYLTFGSFHGDEVISHSKRVDSSMNQTAYYFLDDFQVKRIDKYISGKHIVCLGDTLTLSAHNIDNYQWGFDTTLGTVLIKDSILRIIPYKSGTCEVNFQGGTIKHEFTVINTSQKLLGKDTSMCNGNSLILEVPDDYTAYLWSNNGNANTQKIYNSGNYWVEVDTLGCTIRDSVMVDIQDCSCQPFLPSAFTPNGDGLNDTYHPIISCPLIDFKLEVFDRWGKSVFRSQKYNTSWDGKFNEEYLENGLYILSMYYKSYGGESQTIQKYINLMR